MQDIVNLLVNNGVAVAVIAYFIYRDNKFMNQLSTTLTTLQTSVDSVKKLLQHNLERSEKDETGS